MVAFFLNKEKLTNDYFICARKNNKSDMTFLTTKKMKCS